MIAVINGISPLVLGERETEKESQKTRGSGVSVAYVTVAYNFRTQQPDRQTETTVEVLNDDTVLLLVMRRITSSVWWRRDKSTEVSKAALRRRHRGPSKNRPPLMMMSGEIITDSQESVLKVPEELS